MEEGEPPGSNGHTNGHSKNGHSKNGHSNGVQHHGPEPETYVTPDELFEAFDKERAKYPHLVFSDELTQFRGALFTQLNGMWRKMQTRIEHTVEVRLRKHVEALVCDAFENEVRRRAT